MPDRIQHQPLLEFVVGLFAANGLSREMAEVVGAGFVEAELLGFRSHGVIKVPTNLRWLQAGETLAAGEPEVLSERLATANWDGKRLPGHWVITTLGSLRSPP